jgi:hypothetical protein
MPAPREIRYIVRSSFYCAPQAGVAVWTIEGFEADKQRLLPGFFVFVDAMEPLCVAPRYVKNGIFTDVQSKFSIAAGRDKA